MNLFAGIVIEKFNRTNDLMSGYLKLTMEQRKWIGMQRYMIRLKLIKKRDPP